MLQPYDFFFETPLYTKITINATNLNEFRALLTSRAKINAYSPELKENTTYSIIGFGANHSDIILICYMVVKVNFL